MSPSPVLPLYTMRPTLQTLPWISKGNVRRRWRVLLLLALVVLSVSSFVAFTVVNEYKYVAHARLREWQRSAASAKFAERRLECRAGPTRDRWTLKELKRHNWKCPRFTGSTDITSDCAGYKLSNGICLPVGWPGSLTLRQQIGTARGSQLDVNAPQAEAMYRMASPSEDGDITARPIDLGRQLFVDDFLIESSTLTRRWHAAQVHGRVDVTKPWDAQQDMVNLMLPRGGGDDAGSGDDTDDVQIVRARILSTSVLGGGVFYNPALKVYLLHFLCDLEYPGIAAAAQLQRASWGCVAQSKDGHHWDPPSVLAQLGPGMDRSWVVVPDYAEKAAARRVKMIVPGARAGPDDPGTMRVFASNDGLFWRLAVPSWGRGGIASTYKDRFTNKWVTAIPDPMLGTSVWRYWTQESLLLDLLEQGYRDWTRCQDPSQPATSAARFRDCQRSEALVPTFWTAVDAEDVRQASLEYGNSAAWRRTAARPIDLADFSAFSYESLTVGVFVMHATGPTWPVMADTQLGFSRDTFRFVRPAAPRASVNQPSTRDVLLARAAGNTDQAWVQTRCSGQHVLVDDQHIRLLCTGTPAPAEVPDLDALMHAPVSEQASEIIELRLRRDGFASMATPGPSASGAASSERQAFTLLTRPVVWHSACSLWVNAHVAHGSQLRVAVLDAVSRAVLLDFSQPMLPHDSGTAHLIEWRQDELARFTLLSDLQGMPVQLSFRFDQDRTSEASELYSFWVSSDGERGGSDGFIPGGSAESPCGQDLEVSTYVL